MNLMLARKLRPMLVATLLGALILPLSAQAQLTIPGNNGQDDAFEPTANVQVDLSQAVTGDWETTADSEGKGVYDPEQWAVIFRYTTVTIPAGVTVTFKNHPSRAPVIWLVQGDVTIAGTVSLNGATGHGQEPAAATLAEPGPGGFRGGRGYRNGVPGSAGMGPGGGGHFNTGGAGASYSSLGSVSPSGAVPGDVYGNEGVFPLIGGSGGGGAGLNTQHGGGGGGGAILIASSGTITLNGNVRANGGATQNCCSGHYGGAGSGGSVRLIANVVGGSGGISAVAGAGIGASAGRIRVEANTITLTAAHVNSTGAPQTPPRIFRETGDGVPTIKSMTLNGEAVPDDPASYPTQDVALLDVDDDVSVPLVVTAEHVPEGSAVSARVVRLSGVEEIIPADHNGTNGDETTWLANIPVAGGFSTIQVHAVLP